MAEDNYTNVLLEDIREKLDAVVGAVTVVGDRVERIDERLRRVETNTNRLPAIESAVKEQTKQLHDHEQRLTAVERIA